jgi:hypothetical protein
MTLAVRRRSGAVAAELAMALILAGIAAALAGGMLVAAERRLRRDLANDRASQTVRDVAHLIGADVAAARWDAVVVRGDTALDLQAHIAASVACTASGSVLLLPGAQSTVAPPFTVIRQAPEVNDIALAWDTAGGGRWDEAIIDSVSTPTSGAGCGVPFRSAADSAAHLAVTRLHLTSPLAASVPRGTPIRVYRQVRWALYRSTDNAWWLGYRRCPLGACAAIQPAAGPLAAPADTGLRFAVDASGVVTLRLRPASTNDAPVSVAGVSLSARGAAHAPP